MTTAAPKNQVDEEEHIGKISSATLLVVNCYHGLPNAEIARINSENRGLYIERQYGNGQIGGASSRNGFCYLSSLRSELTCTRSHLYPHLLSKLETNIPEDDAGDIPPSNSVVTIKFAGL